MFRLATVLVALAGLVSASCVPEPNTPTDTPNTPATHANTTLARRDGLSLTYVTIATHLDRSLCLGISARMDNAAISLVPCDDDAAKIILRNTDYIVFATAAMAIDPSLPAIQCLDVTDGDPYKWVQGYDCGFRWPAGNPNQYWQREVWGAPTYKRERIAWASSVIEGQQNTPLNAWCLAIGGETWSEAGEMVRLGDFSVGAPVRMRRCSESDDSQFWYVTHLPYLYE